MGAVVAEGQVFVEDLRMGANHVQHTKLAWMVLQVVHWGRIHHVKDLPWLVRGQLFHGFGILFFWGFVNHSFCV